jgi:hypothetical protein
VDVVSLSRTFAHAGAHFAIAERDREWLAVAELQAGFGQTTGVFLNLTNWTVRADPIDGARKPHDVFGAMI